MVGTIFISLSNKFADVYTKTKLCLKLKTLWYMPRLAGGS